MNKLQIFENYVFLTLAVLSLILLFFTTNARLQFPYDGIAWSQVTGYVEWVDPLVPHANIIKFGDVILRVDEISIKDVHPLYSDKQIGDQVKFDIIRGETNYSTEIKLAAPSLQKKILRLLPVFVAVIFLGIGVYAYAYQSTLITSKLFYLVCLASSVLLLSGSISAFAPNWALFIFGFILWWLPPLLIHLHLCFPVMMLPSKRWERLVLVLYFSAFLGSLSYPIFPTLLDLSASPFIYSIRRLWLVFSVLIVVFLVRSALKKQSSIDVSKKVSWITISSVLALAPFLLLSLIPDALHIRSILPYDLSITFLGVIPLSYGYGILRYRFIYLDKYVNRVFVSVLVTTSLLLVWLLLYSIIVALIPTEIHRQTLPGFLAILFLAVIFSPLYSWIRKFINHFFYGDWYTYQTAIKRVSKTLSTRGADQHVVEALVNDIQKTVQLECTCLLTSQEPGKVRIVTTKDAQCPIYCKDLAQVTPKLNKDGVDKFFYKRINDEPIQFPNDITSTLVTEDEKALLGCSKVKLCLPLSTNGSKISHLLLLGPRWGGDINEEDIEILSSIVPQANILLENMWLIEELREQLKNRERIHQKILDAREQERKRLARELHDNIIQSIIGINYELSGTIRRLDINTKGEFDQTKSKLKSVVNDVRKICIDLRPPSLDNWSAASIVKAIIRDKKKNSPYEIHISIEGDENQELGEEQLLCLFRLLQEALSNIDKHADACKVWISLVITPSEIALTIEDNGVGFVVPKNFHQLASQGHLGLLGIKERVELLDGILTIYSMPGQGSQIFVSLPC